jgi:alpha-L-arabinofuranosidase
MHTRTLGIALTLTLVAVLQVAHAQKSAATPQIASGPSLTIHLDQQTRKVSPTLYGLMTEEINHSYDGGLYAEMVRNRTMRETWDGVNNWTAVTDGTAIASVSGDKTTGPSAALPYSLKVKIDSADATNYAGVRNDGYWGMPVAPNTRYHGSFYAKTDEVAIGNVTVSLVNDETGKLVASASVQGLTSQWKNYEYTLATKDAAAGVSHHLAITVTHPGTLWLSLVSLFPPTYADRANGNRIDVMEKMAALHPQFLRLPGGNYLEGNHIAERFQWKQTVGPLVDRPTHAGPWGYQSSDGLGLLEFLEWCEDLHVQPVLAVYAGYSLAQETTAPGPGLEPYIADALEEIEYVTGDAKTTKWGAVRAQNGHPAPFALTYVEIGNEDYLDNSKNYDGRYAQFFAAVKKKYPALQLIATGPVTSVRPDVIDDHYYRSAVAMAADASHYDKTDRRGPRIFVGEWATIEGVPTPNMSAALADAAWLTGLERNSDIVIMSAYAPLLVNVNPTASQWGTNLIGYNSFASYGSPSYWAQVMFADAMGTDIVAAELSGDDSGGKIFHSVLLDAPHKELHVKVVNTGSREEKIALAVNGGALSDGASQVQLVAPAVTATNSIDAPRAIVPRKSAVTGGTGSLRVPAHSVTVFTFRVK